MSGATRSIRTALLAGAAALAVPAAPALAQNVSAIYAFGDSYADNGNLFRITGTSSPIYPTGRFSGGTNFIDSMSAYLGAPQINFAIGGAQTGTTNVVGPGIPGFAQEVGAFIGGGGFFLPRSVLALSIGGNDARAYELAGGSLAGVNAASSVSAAQATLGIGALVGVGARTIVFTAGDVGKLPEVAGNPQAAVGSAYSAAYNAKMMGSLSALAASGVRVEYISLDAIGAAIAANPGVTGITNLGACPLACVGNPALQAKYQFYVDGVHLTSAAFDVVGRYVVNRLNAPLTFSAQGDMGLVATQGFLSTMFSRLDLFGAERGPTIVPVPLAYAEKVTKGPLGALPVVAPPSPFSVYILAGGGLGQRKQTDVSTGYDWDGFGGTIGAEYRFGREAIVGAAFNYFNPQARLYNGFGQTDLKSYQFGLYGAWTRANFFAQGAVSGGFQRTDVLRPGVLLGNLTASPKGTSFAAGGKVGYLFDSPFSLLPAIESRIGPIVGFNYAWSRTDAYAESGDPALALFVNRQKAEALTGGAGVQLRSEFAFWGNRFETYSNFTAENDFRGSGRTVQYGSTLAPTIVNTWGLPTGRNRVYGRSTSGFSVGLGYGVSATVTTTSTLGRRGGDDYGGQGGIKVAF